MAILQMQRINIFALSKHCKGVLETLQRTGAMQVEEMELSDSVFYKEDTSSLSASYLRNAATIRSAAEIIESLVKQKKSLFDSLKGRKPLSKEEYEKRAESSLEILQEAYDLIRLSKKITESKAKIVTYESRLESLEPWKSLDISMKTKGTRQTKVIIGSFPEQIELESLRLSIAREDPELDSFDVEIISRDDNQTCIFAICMNEDYDRLGNVFRKLGFIMPAFSTGEPPSTAIEMTRQKIKDREKLIEDYKAQIIAKKELIESFRFFEDYFTMKADQYKQIDNISYTPHTFVMTGYVTKRDSEKLKKLLFDKFEAEVELEDVSGDDVPVVLSNNKFSEPVEGVVLSYSAPHRKELDPTGIMAIFYYVFFGLMFSDAGYGLVMSLACLLAILIFKNMEFGLKRSIKMFFWCGISTMIWGLLFGSFFGDAVSVISRTFFETEAPMIPGITTPIWFNPTEGVGPTKLLMFSFLLGIIHLFTGLILQAVNYIRSGKWYYAVFDDLSWILVVTGAVFALLSTEMLASMAGFMLPSVFLTIGGVMAGVGALLILFFSARGGNPIKRLLKGAYNLYGVTSYLSDILSYSRLLALGLATGVVAQVFNQLGSMVGGGVAGAIAFTLIFIVGHLLNIGINALGAYVHTNRLQFVEFFGKFYEGGGKEFAPYAVKTKYYNIKEDI